MKYLKQMAFIIGQIGQVLAHEGWFLPQQQEETELKWVQ